MSQRRVSSDAGASANKYRPLLATISDGNSAEELRLKAAQELADITEGLVQSSHGGAFVEFAVPKLIQTLRACGYVFKVCPIQSMRKLCLEVLCRLPLNPERGQQHAKVVMEFLLEIMENDNEECVNCILRGMQDMMKQCRSTIANEVVKFVQISKGWYREAKNVASSMLADEGEPKAIPDFPAVLGKDGADGKEYKPFSKSTPFVKASHSLKVICDVPVLIVIVYQCYKTAVQSMFAEYLPLAISLLSFAPKTPPGVMPPFKKDVFADVCSAQIKTLSFLGYMYRLSPEAFIGSIPADLIRAILGMLRNTPPEVTFLRRELFVAVRMILGSDLRRSVLPFLPQFFDDATLFGAGYTSHETLKGIVYSTLAEITHHIRSLLSMDQMAMGIFMFARNIHDDNMGVNMQTMSCKLLLNLVDSIRQKTEPNNLGRELLLVLMETFVRKFHTLGEFELPRVFERARIELEESKGASASKSDTAVTSAAAGNESAKTPVPAASDAALAPAAASAPAGALSSSQCLSLNDEFRHVHGAILNPHVPMSQIINDYRYIVKTLICGVKTLTWAMTSGSGACVKSFGPREIELYRRLVKYGFRVLDIHMLLPQPDGSVSIRPSTVTQVRSKEEKELLEHFIGTFNMLPLHDFVDVIGDKIEFIVDRIQGNQVLQMIANGFLAHANVSAAFATILIRHLLEHIENMGKKECQERSNLHLRLFKLVFGSVSLYPNENEHMLKPHLHTLVMRSVDLSLTSEDPYNYLLLTRALFRSIGGGTHDLLYQEFLPLLPALLRNLNNLFGGQHQQHIKDLFIELCLTVPVRLSSLLPYLPLLMGPLVAALNRTPTLMSQGLRTLELCVDNLNPEFLMDHISPVKARLFEALWNIVRNTNDQLSSSAIKLLAKFGGMNRRTLTQTALCYNEEASSGPLFSLTFQGSSKPVQLSVGEAVVTAAKLLKDTSAETYYRQQAWKLIRAYVAGSMNEMEGKDQLLSILKNITLPAEFCPQPDLSDILGPQQKAARRTMCAAISAVVMAANSAETLGEDAREVCTEILRHLVLLAIVQQCGTLAPMSSSTIRYRSQSIDPMVLVDGIVEVLGNDDKDLEDICDFSFKLILETAVCIFKSESKATSLPMFSTIADKVAGLCFKRSWYAKNGGCITLHWLVKEMPLGWLLQHEVAFIKAIYFVILDLQGEVAGATVAMAEKSLEALVRTCHSTQLSAEDESHSCQVKALSGVTQYFINELTSATTSGRKISEKMISVISELTGKTLVDVVAEYSEILHLKVPPAKFQLRHQSLRAQIGLLNGNTFCHNLRPRIFFINIENNAHKNFIQDLTVLCEADDAVLRKNPCYKSATNLTEVRVAALKVLVSCSDVVPLQAKIFNILLQLFGAGKDMVPLQTTAVSLMKEFIEKYSYDLDVVLSLTRPYVMKLSDFRSGSLQIIQRLRWVSHVFPSVFNESFCESMLGNLKRWLDLATYHNNKLQQQEQAFRVMPHAQQQQGKEQFTNTRRSTDSTIENELRCCHAFLLLLSECKAMGLKMLGELVSMVVSGFDKTRSVHVNSLLVDPMFTLITNFGNYVPNLLLSNMNEGAHARMLLHLLRHEKGGELRQFVESNISSVLQTLIMKVDGPTSPELESVQALAIRVIRLVGRFNDKWMSTQQALLTRLRALWEHPSIRLLLSRKCEFVACERWVQPKRIAKCILQYVKYNSAAVDAVFPLLRAVEARSIVSYHFISSFVDEVIIQGYSIEQRRVTYFKFHEVFHDAKYPMDIKCAVLQHIIMPMFHYSFERGDIDELLGGPPDPDGDDPNNIAHQFLLRVMFQQEGLPQPSEALNIYIQQFAALLIQYAPGHIHEANTKVKHGSKLKTLMSLAWPCLSNRVAVDPVAKFNGHMLFANCFLQFSVHKKIPLQMFHCLLQANGIEGRGTVRKVIDVLTPALPHRIEDGLSLMLHWTKQVLVEEGHSAQQLVHILTIVSRHHDTYYSVRHGLVQHLLTGAQRLAFGPSEKRGYGEYKPTLEYRRIALESIETIYNWEHRHDAEGSDTVTPEIAVPVDTSTDAQREGETASGSAVKRSVDDPSGTPEAKKAKTTAGSDLPAIDKKHSELLMYLLVRLACQAGDTGSQSGGSGRESSSSQSGSAGAGGSGSSASASGGSGGMSASLPSSGGSHMITQLSSSTAITPADFAKKTVDLIGCCLKASFWPSVDIRVAWIERALTSNAETAGSVLNACTALEIVTILLDGLTCTQMLAHLKLLHRGIVACISTTNPKIIKATHSLLVRLITVFPIELASTGSCPASKHEELEILYSSISQVALDGLHRYERLRDEELAKAPAATTPQGTRPDNRNMASTAQLFSTLTLLKAVCTVNVMYIDRFIPTFLKVLTRMQKDHIDPVKPSDPGLAEQLAVGIDLLKLRLGFMNSDQRKQYLQCVATLIEKSPDIKLVRAISCIVEEWVTNKASGQQSPTVREKGLLLSRLMSCAEKRFVNDNEFVKQFLGLISTVYRLESAGSGSELSSKLESAFLAGLRSPQPSLRTHFFEIFEKSISKKLHDRLFYILCTQDWTSMGPHFWIKQCVEMVLCTAQNDNAARPVSDSLRLPSVAMTNHPGTSSFRTTPVGSPYARHDELSEERARQPVAAAAAAARLSPMSFSLAEPSPRPAHSEDSKAETSEAPMDTVSGTPMDVDGDSSSGDLECMVEKHAAFVGEMKQLKTQSLLLPIAGLCHASSDLAHKTWLELMPNIWSALTDKERTALSVEVGAFLSSGSHLAQLECRPSIILVFLEAFSKCTPPVEIAPEILSYIGKNYGAHHQATLFLESAVLSQDYLSKQLQRLGVDSHRRNPYAAEGLEYLAQLQDKRENSIQALHEMYVALGEKDLWSALWQGTCRYSETGLALAYQQQGCTEAAQAVYEKLIAKGQDDYSTQPFPPHAAPEIALWEEQWIRCSKELGQWSLLLNLGLSNGGNKPYIVMESSWRIPNWDAFKESLAMVERCCPDYLCPRYNTYRGVLAIGHNEENSHVKVDRLVETSFQQIANLWRNLPSIVSLQHIPLLQQMQLVYELHEANTLHQCVEQVVTSSNRSSNSLHDIKNYTKLWRQRQPNIWDDMSHWSDIVMFRHHQYHMLHTAFDSVNNAQPADRSLSSSAQLFGVHGTASSIIYFAKVCRKQGLFNCCLDNLARIHTIPSVPIIDCYQKIRQQIKCYLQMASTAGITELNEGLETIESTNLKFFNKEMTAEFFAMKGSFLWKLGRNEEANKCFSAAVTLGETMMKPWACWGEFLDQCFLAERNMDTGMNAIVCYLQACRSQSEAKCRKMMSRILWLLAYDNKDQELANVLEKNGTVVSPISWLPWLPQLLALVINMDTLSGRNKGAYIYCLMVHIGRAFPQAMYFPLRSHYLAMKDERQKFMKKPGVAALIGSAPLAPRTSLLGAPAGAEQNPASDGSSMIATDGSASAISSADKMDATKASQSDVSASAQSSDSVVSTTGTPAAPSGSEEAMDTSSAGDTASGDAASAANKRGVEMDKDTPSATPGGNLADVVSPSRRTLQQSRLQSSSDESPAKTTATPAQASDKEQAMDTSSTCGAHVQPVSSVTSTIAASTSATNVSDSSSARGQPVATLGKARTMSSSSLPGGAGLYGGNASVAGVGLRPTQSMVICNKLMVNLREMNPVLLGCMEQVIEQMYHLHVAEDWLQESLGCLRACLSLCHEDAFRGRSNVSGSTASPQLIAVLASLVEKFSSGFQQAASATTGSGDVFATGAVASDGSGTSCAAAAALGDFSVESYLQDFRTDFQLTDEVRLPSIITKLKKWIRILDRKWQLRPKRKMIDSRFILHFTLANAEILLPGEHLLQRNSNGFHIARFLPHMETVVKNDGFAKRIKIQATNGKIYPYLLVSDTPPYNCWREDRVLQLFKFANTMLGKRKEPATRLLQYSIPKATPVAPSIRLMDDDQSDISFMSILEEACRQEQSRSADNAIDMYYDKFAVDQVKHPANSVSQETLSNVYNEICKSVVPNDLLRKWSVKSFASAMDFWHFRSQLTRHLAIYFVAQYAMYLSELSPRDLYLTRSTGHLSARFFRFNINEDTGNLEDNGIVPFRLTPNIVALLAPLHLDGPLAAAMVATARTLAEPGLCLSNYLHAILKDEVILWHRRRYFAQDDFINGLPETCPSDQLIPLVDNATDLIMARLKAIAVYDDGENRAVPLLDKAKDVDNLCQLDPASYPWF